MFFFLYGWMVNEQAVGYGWLAYMHMGRTHPIPEQDSKWSAREMPSLKLLIAGVLYLHTIIQP